MSKLLGRHTILLSMQRTNSIETDCRSLILISSLKFSQADSIKRKRVIKKTIYGILVFGANIYSRTDGINAKAKEKKLLQSFK